MGHAMALQFLARLAQAAPGQALDPRQMLLSQLRDVQAPAAVGWWPPAPGWWLLAAVTGAALAAMALALRRRWRGNRYRRQALAELGKLKGATLSTPLMAQNIMRVLKRAFFSAYPSSRRQVAGLYGDAWLELLAHTCPKKLVTRPPNGHLDALLYRKNPDPSAQTGAQLFHFAESWIRHHRRGKAKTTQDIYHYLSTRSRPSVSGGARV